MLLAFIPSKSRDLPLLWHRPGFCLPGQAARRQRQGSGALNQWLVATLDTTTLEKAWSFVMRIRRSSSRQRRWRRIESIVLNFRRINPRPSEAAWLRLAGHLIAAGFYSERTAKCDILVRVRRIKRPKKA